MGHEIPGRKPENLLSLTFSLFRMFHRQSDLPGVTGLTSNLQRPVRLRMRPHRHNAANDRRTPQRKRKLTRYQCVAGDMLATDVHTALVGRAVGTAAQNEPGARYPELACAA